MSPSGKHSALLARADGFATSAERLLSKPNPFEIVVDDVTGPVEVVIDGRPTLLFGINSYLGLNFHPSCIAAAVAATESRGTGSTASRVAAGNHRAHVELEQELAAFYGRRQAVVFSTGFMANLGVISALARRGDAIFLDEHCHASIFDACKLSGAEYTKFKHNEAADLARLLAASPIPAERTLVIAEALYSVRGDLGELKSICAVTKRSGALPVVDEAHSLGLFGEHGRGVAEHLGVEDDVDVIVGTFSKSVGVIGGYAVSSSDALRKLYLMARSYLYTASLPPPIVAAAREAIRLIATDGPRLRDTLWNNVRRMHAGFSELGLKIHGSPGPVGSIGLPGMASAVRLWRDLLRRGIYLNLLLPPATPEGEPVLRFSVSAAHKPEHIDAALGAMREALSLSRRSPAKPDAVIASSAATNANWVNRSHNGSTSGRMRPAASNPFSCAAILIRLLTSRLNCTSPTQDRPSRAAHHSGSTPMPAAETAPRPVTTILSGHMFRLDCAGFVSRRVRRTSRDRRCRRYRHRPERRRRIFLRSPARS